MLTIRVDYERLNGRYTNAEYRGKITRCDLTLHIKYSPPPPPAVLIISKSCRFSPETEFTPLFFASKSAPLCKTNKFAPAPPFQKSAYGPEIISSFKLWTRVLFLTDHSMLKS